MGRKKNLLTLAKELDFSTECEYFDYMIDSFLNGAMAQCRKLFADMKYQDRKEFISYIDEFNYPSVKQFYFKLL